MDKTNQIQSVKSVSHNRGIVKNLDISSVSLEDLKLSQCLQNVLDGVSPIKSVNSCFGCIHYTLCSDDLPCFICSRNYDVSRGLNDLYQGYGM